MTRLKSLLKNFVRKKVKCVSSFMVFVVFIVYVYFIFLKRRESETSLMISQTAHEHVLCVLVPFRNAFTELNEFIPFMNEFLNRQKIKFHFIVVNHIPDGNRFNKGSTFNAGFDLISKKYTDCDYIALHDVDLLPLNDEISYAYPGDDVYNAANPDYHPLGEYYDPARYVGGISLISNQQYIRAGGFGNNFWGWGGEDRNFFYRMSNNSINRVRPTNLSTDRTNTFKNIHSPHRHRDFARCGNQTEAELVEYDFETGFHNVEYQLEYTQLLTIKGISFNFFGISIPCDYSKTPWCKPFCKNNT